jgi:hypothetical protein
MLTANASSTTSLSAAICNVWFIGWALRHAGELDHQFDAADRIARWLVVVGCFGTWLYVHPLLALPTVRGWIGVVGFAFLVWPNFAYHLTNALRWLRILPKRQGEEADTAVMP